MENKLWGIYLVQVDLGELIKCLKILKPVIFEKLSQILCNYFIIYIRQEMEYLLMLLF